MGLISRFIISPEMLNSVYETGFRNPIDKAIRQYRQFDVTDCEKLAEIPYDFYRKRLSLLISKQGENMLVTKGALTNVLTACTEAENADGTQTPIASVSDQIQLSYEDFSRQGFRTLGLAYKPMDAQIRIAKTDEAGMCFLGFLLFFDPPKADCAETIQQLRELGVTLKIIAGDNRLVAATVSRQLGLAEHEILTSPEIKQMSGRALMNKVADVDLFAEVEPNQKEHIIIALKKAGFVVGYMGDGINDVSVQQAVFFQSARQLSGRRNAHYRRRHLVITLYADCAVNRS